MGYQLIRTRIGSTCDSFSRYVPSNLSGGTKYRPEIDGLRAVAILLVVLFHAGYSWIPGGFVGVDVFFVISGYLISRLTLVQLRAGHFSFGSFYARRVRRLAPALLTTIAGTLLIAFVIFSLDDFVRLGLEATAALFGVSNFFFEGRGDYFDQAPRNFALLHTWSLAVEEQYYLAAPFVAYWLHRMFGLSGVWVFSVLVLILALISAQIILNYNAEIAFYWPIFRAWEFILGGLLLWMPSMEKARLRTTNGLTLLGLTMIAIAALSFDKTTGIPGWAALLPTLGAAAIIWGARSDGIGYLLSNPLAIRLGLLSYSLYLTHWPVMIFFAYLRRSPYLLPADRPFAIALAIALAILLFTLVEKPLRRKDTGQPAIPQWPFVRNCGFVLGGLAILSTIIFWTGGWSWRLITPYNVAQEGYGACKRLNECSVGADIAPSVILVGDSHAKHLAAGFHHWGVVAKKNVMILSSPSCHVLSFEESFPVQLAGCNNFNDHVEQRIAEFPDLPLMVALRWRGHATTKVLIETLDSYLAVHSNRNITVVGQLPQVGVWLSKCGQVSTFVMSRAACESRFNSPSATELNKSLFGVVARHSNATFVNPLGVLCPAGHCSAVSGLEPNFIDEHHLSANAANQIVIQQIVPRAGL